MKYIILVSLIFSGFVQAQNLPAFYDDLSINRISVWPNSTSPTYGYTVYLTSAMNNTGCNNSNIFSVLSGDFQKESYSILLAAFMSGKKIRVRVAECSDRPLVDRVEIIN